MRQTSQPNHPFGPALKKVVAGLLVGAALISGPAAAQDASTYYTVEHPGKFKINWAQFYIKAMEATQAVRDALPHKLNLAYGSNPKQALDLYFPKNAPKGAPVLLFLHGGGFREGDRAQYGFVAAPFAAHGIITAVASYRLTGTGDHYPAQNDDAKAAVKWLYDNIAKFGGDPKNIYISGHSAGAVLVADLAVDRAWMAADGIPKCAVRGVAPLSGIYELRGSTDLGDYTPTVADEDAASAIRHITDPAPLWLVVAGTADLADAIQTSPPFVDKLKAAHVEANLLMLKGDDHRGVVWQLSRDKTELADAMLAMIRAGGKETCK